MYLLFPGRHHLITQFQFSYLQQLIESGLENQYDVFGNKFESDEPVEGIIFAVTSANHSGTKRNPIPFYQRGLILQELSNALDMPTYIYGIDDVGLIDNFSKHTIKSIEHQSDRYIKITPNN